MIRSFKPRGLQQAFESRNFRYLPPEYRKKTCTILAALDAAAKPPAASRRSNPQSEPTPHCKPTLRLQAARTGSERRTGSQRGFVQTSLVPSSSPLRGRIATLPQGCYPPSTDDQNFNS